MVIRVSDETIVLKYYGEINFEERSDQTCLTAVTLTTLLLRRYINR